MSSVRAPRARPCDCGPSTDFNLCASERGYSIEAARSRQQPPVRHTHIRVDNEEANEGRGLCLTEGPLHTRNSRGPDLEGPGLESSTVHAFLVRTRLPWKWST